MGDTIYAGPDHSLEGYRATWAENFAVQGLQDMFTATPSIPGWDDHEMANNWDQDPPEPEELAAGYQAFFEHAPMRRHGSHPNRIWRSFRYGHTAEVFVLDCRGERIFRERYISPRQMEWLKRGLAASTATWKVIVNSVPITDFPGPYDAPIAFDDRWEAYPEQRAELLDFITGNDLQGVLFVSGDFHQCALARIDPEGPANHLLEFVTGAVASNNNLLAPLIQDGEQFPYSDAVWSTTLFELDHFGFARITVVNDGNDTVFDGMIDTRGHILWYEMTRSADQR
jgi:alkaline phosphatase D